MVALSRLVVAAGVAGLLAAVAAGCGGGSQDSARCDDAGFRNQSEELYVTIATAQNAAAPGVPDSVVDDLRKGVAALTGHLDAHPPCDDALWELESRERAALASLETALTALEGGEDASSDLTAAVEALGEVEEALR